MGQKLYQKDDQGIRFISYRKGEVRIPNYVYDLWFPLLGATAIGVYSMYCRLEREDVVKAMTQRRIAKMCRIGTDKLEKINDMLETCGFVKITKPEGHKKLMHWTTEIEIYDPPTEINQHLISEYSHPSGYEPLSPWLVSPKTPDSVSDEPKQVLDKTPNGASNVVSLGLNPLEVHSSNDERIPSTFEYEMVDETDSEISCSCGENIVIERLSNSKAQCPKCDLPIRIINWLGKVIKRPSQSARQRESGFDGNLERFDEKPLQGFCALYGIPYNGMPIKKRKQWGHQIQKVAQEHDANIEITYRAIKEIKSSEHSWQSFKNPFQQGFQDLLDIMIMRIQSGNTEWKRDNADNRPAGYYDEGWEIND